MVYLTVSSLGYLPRDSKRVINGHQRAQKKLMRMNLPVSWKDNKALRNLQWMPSSRVVYLVDENVDDILRECCCPDSRSILSIDTTFDVSNFYVTTKMYQSKKVISKKILNLLTCQDLQCYIPPKLKGTTSTSPTPFVKVIMYWRELCL